MYNTPITAKLNEIYSEMLEIGVVYGYYHTKRPNKKKSIKFTLKMIKTTGLDVRSISIHHIVS